MERIKNPEANESYREAKTKDAKMKAAKQMMAEREFVRMATVLKDRSDIMDGKVFYNPSYADFAPHWESINIGGEHKPLESGDSQGLFDSEGRPDWVIAKKRATIALEELKAEVDKVYPSSSAKEKQARIKVMEKVFGTSSSTKIEGMSFGVLEQGLRRVKTLLGVPENTIDNVAAGIILEPPDEDVPLNIGKSEAHESNPEA
jgi:hypothetical protein